MTGWQMRALIKEAKLRAVLTFLTFQMLCVAENSPALRNMVVAASCCGDAFLENREMDAARCRAKNFKNQCFFFLLCFTNIFNFGVPEQIPPKYNKVCVCHVTKCETLDRVLMDLRGINKNQPVYTAVMVSPASFFFLMHSSTSRILGCLDINLSSK